MLLESTKIFQGRLNRLVPVPATPVVFHVHPEPKHERFSSNMFTLSPSSIDLQVGTVVVVVLVVLVEMVVDVLVLVLVLVDVEALVIEVLVVVVSMIDSVQKKEQTGRWFTCVGGYKK